MIFRGGNVALLLECSFGSCSVIVRVRVVLKRTVVGDSECFS